MTRDRTIISEKDAREQAKRALDALSENPLLINLERALATGDTDEIKRAQDALDESTKGLPPLDPLLVEFVKALARDHARRDNREAGQQRGEEAQAEPKPWKARLTEVGPSQEAELLKHRGYRIRITHAGLEWIAAVALPEQRPTLIMAPNREAAIKKIYEWVDLQLSSDKNPE